MSRSKVDPEQIKRLSKTAGKITGSVVRMFTDHCKWSPCDKAGV